MTDGDRDGDAGADDDPAETVVVERLDPEESFELVAHETRLGTLRELNDTDGPLAHSELRERVGVDDPGGFNYHLQKLDGTFVRGNEEGYELTAAGRRVVGAVLSGGYTAALSGDAIAMDADCMHCGGPLETRFREDQVYVACTECDVEVNDVEAPPGVFEDYDRAAVPAVVDSWVKRHISLSEYGFCPRCDGRLDERLVRADAADVPDGLGDIPVAVVVHYDCRRCSHRRYAMLPAVGALHPAVVGFHYDHGINLRETSFRELDWLEMGIASVVETDALVAEFDVTLDDETLTVAFDESVSLVRESRESATAADTET
jgi:hypothetical protein